MISFVYSTKEIATTNIPVLYFINFLDLKILNGKRLNVFMMT
jgi:hypothetical protein